MDTPCTPQRRKCSISITRGYILSKTLQYIMLMSQKPSNVNQCKQGLTNLKYQIQPIYTILKKTKQKQKQSKTKQKNKQHLDLLILFKS